MLKLIGIVVVLAVACVLVLAALRPDTFRVQRSRSIKAPPERIFPLINDLRRFNTWNPFGGKDPNLKGSYSGAEAGAGAAYAFDGNKEMSKRRSAERVEIREGSGNVYRDLGFPDAEEMLANLVSKIGEIIRSAQPT